MEGRSSYRGAQCRSVLLGDLQNLLSLYRRRINTAVSNSITEEAQKAPVALYKAVNATRTRLLASKNVLELDTSTILAPLLALIRHEGVTSIVTSAALETTMHLVQLYPWDDLEESYSRQASDAAVDIIEALVQCRFQEVAVESDQQVLVNVVHALNTVRTSSLGYALSDHAMWQLIESLYALSRASRFDVHVPSSLRTTAIHFLGETISFLFSTIVDDDARAQSTLQFGMPCAIRVLSFLSKKLHFTSVPTSEYTSVSASKATVAMSSTSGSSSRREMGLVLSLWQRVLSSSNPTTVLSSPSLCYFIQDDLCMAVLRLGKLGASQDRRVALGAMDLFRSLYLSYRSALRMQIETIWNGVFIHCLRWTRHALETSLGVTPGSDNMPVEASNDLLSGNPVPFQRLQSLSIDILECLIDFIGQENVLEELYVNYDCVIGRCDVVNTVLRSFHSLIQLSQDVCRQVGEEEGGELFQWSQNVAELSLRALSHPLQLWHHSDAVFKIDEQVESDRKKKIEFQKAVEEFNRKPTTGIKLLEEQNFFPSPVDAKSLAAFLRSLPHGLEKSKVGEYLGAVGKDPSDSKHESESSTFHEQVLREYVASFRFQDEGILSALRVFLSAFRLPGEAQQIDRILNAFASIVYRQSRDRSAFASEDVAYLLSFSLIMLNTDLHNPNIRPEKKMSRIAFLRNNLNYGQEVSCGRELPEDFLNELYDNIAQHEFRTLEDSNGQVTEDRWRDLLLRHEQDNSYRTDTQPAVRKQIFLDHASHLASAFETVFDQFVLASTTDISPESEDNDEENALFYLPDHTLLQIAANGLVSIAAVASRLHVSDIFHGIFVSLSELTALVPSDKYPIPLTTRDDGCGQFMANESCCAALAASFTLFREHPGSFQKDTWSYLLHLISALRLLQALPPGSLRLDEDKEMLSRAENRNFLRAVRRNRLLLEQKQVTSDDDAGFFSGVTWFLSALDANFRGEPEEDSDEEIPRSSFSSAELRGEKALPSWLAQNADDLVASKSVRTRSLSLRSETETDESVESLQELLRPYHLESFLQDLCVLPSENAGYIVDALIDQLEGEGRGAGRVLFAHVLSCLLASTSETSILQRGCQHYERLLPLLRQELEKDVDASDYSTTCVETYKALTGVFSVASNNYVDVSDSARLVNTALTFGSTNSLLSPLLLQLIRGLAHVLEHKPSDAVPTLLSVLQWKSVEGSMKAFLTSPFHASAMSSLLCQLIHHHVWQVDEDGMNVMDLAGFIVQSALKSSMQGTTVSDTKSVALLVVLSNNLDETAMQQVSRREETEVELKTLHMRLVGGVFKISNSLVSMVQEEEDSASVSIIEEELNACIDCCSNMLSSGSWQVSAESLDAVIASGLLPLYRSLVDPSWDDGLAESIHADLNYFKSADVSNESQSLRRIRSYSSASGNGRKLSATMENQDRAHLQLLRLICSVIRDNFGKLSTVPSFVSETWGHVLDALCKSIKMDVEEDTTQSVRKVMMACRVNGTEKLVKEMERKGKEHDVFETVSGAASPAEAEEG